MLEEVIIMDKGRILLKENTQELLESCFHVSGRGDLVDEAVKGYETHHPESIGRSKSVMVRTKPGAESAQGGRNHGTAHESSEGICGTVRRGGINL